MRPGTNLLQSEMRYHRPCCENPHPSTPTLPPASSSPHPLQSACTTVENNTDGKYEWGRQRKRVGHTMARLQGCIYQELGSPRGFRAGCKGCRGHKSLPVGVIALGPTVSPNAYGRNWRWRHSSNHVLGCPIKFWRDRGGKRSRGEGVRRLRSAGAQFRKDQGAGPCETQPRCSCMQLLLGIQRSFGLRGPREGQERGRMRLREPSGTGP